MKRYQLILIRGWWLVLFSPLLPVENWPAEPARPQPQAAAQSKWTVDDIVRAESAGSFDIAPDCRWAVWVKTAPDKDQGKDVSNLMLSSVTERKTIELTRGKESCTKPKWSPDGQLIAFLTARPNPIAKPKPDGPGEESDLKDDKKPQLWLINPFGGEPWALTDLARGIAMYGWADAETIVFAAQEEKALPELSAKEKKDTAQAVEDEPHEPPVRLFKVAVKSKKITRLSDNTDWIRQLFVAPHGRHAVTIHEQSLRHTWDQKIKPAVFLYDLRTMERKQIFTEPGFNIAALKWTPDSLGFYATSRFTTHPRYVLATVTEVYFYELEKSKASFTTRTIISRGESTRWS